LAACLTSKAKEESYFDWLGDADHHDGVESMYAPPRIYSLHTLRKYILRAMNELETLQVTVERHEPRQLVPIKLGLLAANPWVDEVDQVKLEEEL
jgi:hypothetical protein